ncbi:hypothetical protein CRUP_003300, partial [Coryphaenoides rupestris]
PVFYFGETEYRVDESDGHLEVKVWRTGTDLSKAATVTVRSRKTEPVSAEAGIDYVGISRNLDFAPGVSEQTIRVTVLDDLGRPELEGVERFELVLRMPAHGILGEPARATVFINDSLTDLPQVQFREPVYSGKESDGRILATVYRSGDIRHQSTVRCYTRQGSAQVADDFDERPNTDASVITFLPGEAEKPCVLTLVDDTLYEEDEDLRLVLGAPKSDSLFGASVGSPSETLIKIADAADKPIIRFAETKFSLSEPKEAGGTAVVRIPLVRLGDTSKVSVVRVHTKDGSAVSGEDYNPISQVYLPHLCSNRTVSAVLLDRNAVTKAIVYIEETYSMADVTFPSLPHVVSLLHYDDASRTPENLHPPAGYPVVCVTPRKLGTVGAEPFSAKLRYTGADDPEHPNLIKLTQPPFAHVVYMGEVTTGHGFVTATTRNPESMGDAEPYQYSAALRSNRTLRFYRNLNLEACLWDFSSYYDMSELLSDCGGTVGTDGQVDALHHRTLRFYRNLNLEACLWDFSSYYDMSELLSDCGGTVGTDGQVLNLVQSYVTLRVPLHVSYVFHSPVGSGGWQHFDLQSELRLTFVYDTAILWRDGIGSPPQAELQAPPPLALPQTRPRPLLTLELGLRWAPDAVPPEDGRVVDEGEPQLRLQVKVLPAAAAHRRVEDVGDVQGHPQRDGSASPMLSGLRVVAVTKPWPVVTSSPDGTRVGNHRCSNLLDYDEVTTGHGFVTATTRNPESMGDAEPYQYSAALRSNRTLRFYRNLNLEACLWDFSSYYDMSELLSDCGGTVGTDGQVLNLVQSYVTLRVPLHVSYVFHSPVGSGGWQHFDLQSELRLTFVYDTAILWRDGIGSPPQAELQGALYPTSMRINDQGRLVVNFRTKARFRGLFIESHSRGRVTRALGSVSSMVMCADHPGLTFNLSLVRSEPSYNQPVQQWTFISDFANMEYTIPPVCNPRDPVTFDLDIRFQQRWSFSLNTQMLLLSKRSLWLSDGAMGFGQDSDAAFSEGDTIYGRVMVDPVQNLGDSFFCNIEKVYLCTGADGYDKAQPETQARAFGDVSFNAALAIDDPSALPLARQPGSDGFRLDSTAMFQVHAAGGGGDIGTDNDRGTNIMHIALDRTKRRAPGAGAGQQFSAEGLEPRELSAGGRGEEEEGAVVVVAVGAVVGVLLTALLAMAVLALGLRAQRQGGGGCGKEARKGGPMQEAMSGSVSKDPMLVVRMQDCQDSSEV